MALPKRKTSKSKRDKRRTHQKHAAPNTTKCPECGESKEIFSDEFDKTHTCAKCGKPIDFTQCTLDGST